MTRALSDIVKNAIDLHVQCWKPEMSQGSLAAQSLCQAEKGKIAGCVLKNHFYPSIPLVEEQDNAGVKLYGSVVLNASWED